MNDSHFIAIQADSSDPIQAATIANAVSRAFVRYHMLRRMQINNEVFVYLQEQKQKEELALQEAEQKLQKFREETNISSLDNADKDSQKGKSGMQSREMNAPYREMLQQKVDALGGAR